MRSAALAAGTRLAFDLPAVSAPGSSLAEAVLRTLAYGDVFAFPLTESELHRYLIGQAATPVDINRLLASGALEGWISRAGPYICLRGREDLLQVRQERARHAARLWPAAVYYGQRLAALPYVRMAAVTGSLAVGNPRPQDDLDYLLVTAPGRVWLARLLALGVVRWAQQRGQRVCPNYLLSEAALASLPQELYSAHELAQMVPLSGEVVYARLRSANPWVRDYLPNARGLPAGWGFPPVGFQASRLAPVLEKGVPRPLADRLERWEMQRKVRRLAAQAPGSPEAQFGPDWCKGHFDGHGGRALAAYSARLAVLGLAVS